MRSLGSAYSLPLGGDSVCGNSLLDGGSNHSTKSFGSSNSLTSMTGSLRRDSSMDSFASDCSSYHSTSRRITPSPTSATTVLEEVDERSKRHVKFSRRVRANPILDIRDYTTDEIANKYWSSKELNKIRDNLLTDIQTLDYDYHNKGIVPDLVDDGSRVECVRGIECRTALGAKQRMSYKISSRKTLREEQERQYKKSLTTKGKMCIIDDEQLAYVCVMNNRQSKEEAYQRGKLDEQFALKDYYKSNKIKTKKSKKDKKKSDSK